MANRVIRDWTDSEKVDLLSFQAEVLFIRLAMKADDYGSFHANVKLVKAALFPLKMDTIREADISRWMDELLKAGLIVFYKVESKAFLRILNFGQRMRSMKKRFPDIPNGHSQQSAASSGGMPPEEKGREIESETDNEDEEDPPPSDFSTGNFNQSTFSPAAQPQNFGDIDPGEMLLQSEVDFCHEKYMSSTYHFRTREMLCMRLHFDENTLFDWGIAFNEYLIGSGKPKKTLKDWAEHFQNWLSKQDTSQNPKLKFKNEQRNKKGGTGAGSSLNADYKRKLAERMAASAGKG